MLSRQSYWDLEHSRELFREDVIHTPGFRLSAATDSFVNTKAFGRLADLKQLGTASCHFTSATHTRYAHSLGVAHLAEQWASRIYSQQARELGMEPVDLVLAELAGVAHDLGHGCFSHVFEKEILPNLGIHDFHHEEMSCKMLELAQAEAYIDEAEHGLTEDDIGKVQDLIMGAEHRGRPPEKAFLFDIVANGRNGLDVDKLDYLPRDAYHTVQNIPGDFKRLQHFISVSSDEICFDESEWSNVQAVYDARRRMHQEVYQHPRVIAMGKMVADMIVAAEPLLDLRGCIQDPLRFSELGDSVLQTIASQHALMEQRPPLFADADGIIASSLSSAVAVWHRMQKQDFYTLVGECVRPVKSECKAPTPAELMKHSHSSGQLLKEADIIVHSAHIDYSQKDRDPMLSVSFINRMGERVKYKQDDFTVLLTKQYQEEKLMVFSKSPDREAQDALRDAWTHWCRSNDLGKAKNTPSKPDARPRKRPRNSLARRTLEMNGNGAIAEGIELVDDADVPLSQDGYLTCSQELLPLSQDGLGS